jgi:hypothetical protein
VDENERKKVRTMSIKNAGRWLMSLCFGSMLVVAPAALLAAGNNDPGVGSHNFNSPVVPATSEQTPGFHSLKYKHVDDDDDDGGGFGFGFGFGGPQWGGGWYDGGYWGPPSYYYSVPQPRRGELKIDTHTRNAQVYIDKAYAGTVKDKDHFALRPGTYQLEIRASNGVTFNTRIYVTRGQTLIVRPDFAHMG